MELAAAPPQASAQPAAHGLDTELSAMHTAAAPTTQQPQQAAHGLDAEFAAAQTAPAAYGLSGEIAATGTAQPQLQPQAPPPTAGAGIPPLQIPTSYQPSQPGPGFAPPVVQQQPMQAFGGPPPRSASQAAAMAKPSYTRPPTKGEEFRSKMRTDRHQYLSSLGQLAPGVVPSALQHLVKTKRNALSSVISPKLAMDGMHLESVPMSGEATNTFKVQLVDATGVPSSGLPDSAKEVRIARMCLCYQDTKMDKTGVSETFTDFVGNVQAAVAQQQASNSSATSRFGARTPSPQAKAHWQFNNQMASFIVRAAPDARRGARSLKLHIELNVSPDSSAMPGSLPSSASKELEAKKRQAQVDEVTTAWCTVNLEGQVLQLRPGSGQSIMFDVRLCTGRIGAPMTLGASTAEPPACCGGIFGRRRTPHTLRVRITALPSKLAREPSILPSRMIASLELLPILVLYRKAVAAAQSAGVPHKVVMDPLVKYLPSILDDPVGLRSLMSLWNTVSNSRFVSEVQKLETLRNCCLRCFVAMASTAIPPQANTNDTAKQAERSKVMSAMVMSEPHITLNNQFPFGEGDGTTKFTEVAVHNPFDVSESMQQPNAGQGLSTAMLST